MRPPNGYRSERMKLWIRIDVAIRSDPNVAELASRLNVTLAEAVGLCTLTWAAIGEHRPNADLSGIGIAALEKWGGWEPRKGKPAGAFGRAFKELFISGDEASGWHDRQGALIDRTEKETARKARNRLANVLRTSAVTERNVTEQQPTTQEIEPEAPTVPDIPRRSKKKMGGLTATPEESELFAHYRQKHPRRGPPDDDQIRKVRRALAGYSLESLKQAVDGNLEDPWCVKIGKHEIGWIFKNNDHIDRAIESYRRANAPLYDDSGKLTADGQRVFAS